MISARFTVIRSNAGLKTHCHVLWIIWSSEQQCICQTFDQHFHHEGEVQMRDQYPLFDSRALIAWTHLCKPVKSMSTESSNWKFSFTRTRFHCWSNSVPSGQIWPFENGGILRWLLLLVSECSNRFRQGRSAHHLIAYFISLYSRCYATILPSGPCYWWILATATCVFASPNRNPIYSWSHYHILWSGIHRTTKQSLWQLKLGTMLNRSRFFAKAFGPWIL